MSAQPHPSVAHKPSVLFVCVKNGGKSQMAAGLMRKIAGDTIDVDSAGTKPAAVINGLSAQTLLEVGVDITLQTPRQLTDDLIREVDRVIVLGRDARVAPVDGTPVEVWDTDEPSERGITASNACASSATTSPAESSTSPTNSTINPPSEPDTTTPDAR